MGRCGEDEEVKKIRGAIGSVNQFVDSTDVLCSPELCVRSYTHPMGRIRIKSDSEPVVCAGVYVCVRAT